MVFDGMELNPDMKFLHGEEMKFLLRKAQVWTMVMVHQMH